MSKRLRGWMWKSTITGSALLASVALWQARAFAESPVPVPPAHMADTGTTPEASSPEELKTQAFLVLRSGQFDQSNRLLARVAAADPQDTQLAQMAQWSKQFQDQRHIFLEERHNQYQQAVAYVKRLQEHDTQRYLLMGVSEAYVLADNKQSFTNEPWVKEIIDAAIDYSREYETQGQWLKALQLYQRLSTLQPAVAEWKDKLKLATRRVRLVSLYAPDQFKVMVEAETKDRAAADALREPTTQPSARNSTTKPTTQSIEEADDSFHTDWHDSLRGITRGMLDDALGLAYSNYYREVSYKNLLVGALSGVRALLTTQGLEKTFTGLAEDAARQKMLGQVELWIGDAQKLQPGDAKDAMEADLRKLRDLNNSTVKFPSEVLINEIADGAFGELDPFSNMIWPSEREEFNKSTNGEFSGVGIQIQSDDDGSLRVVSPLEDSPAYKAGIAAGDIISHINGKNAKGISLNMAVRTITGVEGTTVTLTVRSPDGKVREIPLKREKVKVASVKGWSRHNGTGWDYFVDPEQKIAYIRLTNFTRTSAEEIERAVNEIQEAGGAGIILDLRYNPGGLLNAATEICDKFLSAGVIVSTRADRPDSPNPPTKNVSKADAEDCKLPMVVLVNQFSASASEIVSGALKDQGRALVVGERTFGKGSVQMLFQVADRRAFFKLTTSHYYLPSGRCLHREENSTEWGVDPDVLVEMTPDQMKAANLSRQVMDVLHNGEIMTTLPSTAPTKDPLNSDPQLSAALLLLRLQVKGAKLMDTHAAAKF